MYALVEGKNGPKFRDAAGDEKGGLDDRPGQLVFKKTPMSSLAALLANILDTPVEDMTGLNGSTRRALASGDESASKPRPQLCAQIITAAATDGEPMGRQGRRTRQCY
jgi:uncharacterized protein (TIGR03435 family)